MTVVETYALQIVHETGTFDITILELFELRRLLAESEENLTDLLPHGYRCRITPWNEEPTDE